jgi:hypothetical protein
MPANIKTILLLFVSFTFISLNSFGQDVLTGKVIDSKTSLGIPGVSLKVAKQGTVAISDAEGHFKFTFVKGSSDSLAFSAIGYQTFKISLQQVKQDQVIKLEEDNNQLTDVNIFGGKAQQVTLNNFPKKGAITTKFVKELAQSFKLGTGSWKLLNINVTFNENYYEINPGFSCIVKVYNSGERKPYPNQVLKSFNVQFTAKDKGVVNLAVDSLQLETGQFYISIEKIYTPYNERYDVENWGGKGVTFAVYYAPDLYSKPKSEETIWYREKNGIKWVSYKGTLSIAPTLFRN